MNYEVVNLDQLICVGKKIRTDNATEFSDKGQIPALWEDFRNNLYAKKIPASLPVGIYFNYESDASGKYSLLAGVEVDNDYKPSSEELAVLKTKPGRYLKFSNSGVMPQVVIDCWKEIWSYFEKEDCEHKRTYASDIEMYKSENEVEIYIAIE